MTIFVVLLSPPYTMNFWKFLTERIIIYSTPKWGWASLHITSTLYYWGDAGGRDFWKHAAYGVLINFARPECNDEKLGENVACGWMVSMSKSSLINCLTPKCIFQYSEHNKFENAPWPYSDIEVSQKIQPNFWRGVKQKIGYRNMRGCILEVNPEGLGW